ncbi:MAG: alpha/beta fold hydrolase, partial [Alphaproteobacteria bacterium]
MLTRILVLAAAVSFPAFAADPHARIEPHRFKGPEGREVAAEIGRFEVPVNRGGGASETMELAFVRFPSTNPNPGAPIVYLAGGPGGSGTGTAAGPRFPLFMKLRQVADVIAFDQRGTGLSHTPPPCPDQKPLPLERAGTREAWIEHIGAEIRRCTAFWRAEGVDLAAYNTRESADDLEDLRKALGADRIALWGISYGTHLALAMLKRHPDSVERVVLA